MVAAVAVPQAMWRPQLAQHRVVAWDSETYRTVPGRTAPRMVCSQFYDPACRPGPELLHAKGNARQRVWELMLDDSVLLTGHNINYDLAVMAENAGIGGFDVSQDQVLWQIFQLFLRNRIRCTQTREKLILIRDGTLQYAKKGVYNLDGCVKKYLNIDLNKGEGKAMKYWTLHYHLGWDQPIGMWPAAARKYALDDVTSTYGVAMGQQEYVEKIGYTGSAPFSVANEMKQVRTAWVLHLMSCWGIRTDPEAIQKLEERLWKEVEECAVEMRKGGILRDNESKNMSVLKERILRACAAKGVYPVLTPKGELAQQAANDAGQPFKLELEHVATSKKAIKPIEKLDPVLKSVVNFNHAEKLLSNFVEAAKGGIHHPINARFNNPIATGRISGSQPNLLNLPQGDGIRQCFRARDDHVLSSSDYSVLELRTLAQICHDMGLYSGLREAFIKGRDPHLEFGAKLARTEYSTFLAAFNGDEGPDRRKWSKDFRQRAKCFHPDVEFLTREGWRTWDQLTAGVQIAQAVPKASGCAIEWVIPTNLFWKNADAGLVHLKNEGMDLMVTPDHRMVGYKTNGQPAVVAPERLNNLRGWWNAGTYAGGAVSVDKTLLQLAVATQADGSYTNNRGIRFGFVKQRKVERFRSLFGHLLTSDGVEREVNSGSLATFFNVRAEVGDQVRALLTPEKEFPAWWLDLSPDCRTVVLEEARFWDSHIIKGGHAAIFLSTSKRSTDVLQAIAAITGRKTRQVETPPQEEHHSPGYRLTIRDKDTSRAGALDVKSLPYTGRVVCLSVPSGAVLVRQNGVPVIVGQCFNFGKPGGLGTTRFIDYARAFGVEFSEQEVKALSNEWMDTWPEMRGYFKWIRNQQDENKWITLHQPRSDRIRGRCTYTQGANSCFQGLAADGATDALWEISYECYLVRSSDLYGSRPLVFPYDEIVAEHPKEHASPAARRLAMLMESVMHERWTPDVPQSVEPVLMNRWDKEAKPVFNDEGFLIAWDSDEED